MNSATFEIEPRVEKGPALSKMLPAVVFSLVLHGGLLAVLMNSEISEPELERRTFVSVRLYPESPLQEIGNEAPLVESTEPDAIIENVDTEIEFDSIEPVQEISAVAETEATVPNQQPVQADDAEIEALDAAPVRPSDRGSEVAPPTVATVRESLRQLDDTSSSLFYRYDCNPLEEEAGIKECNPSLGQTPDGRGYQPAERSLVYRGLNPVREISRSEKSLDVVSSHSRELAERLGSVAVPEGLSDYVMQEVEAGITHNADLGNRAVQHMINSTDKSAAGAMARELLSDPWVVNKAKQNRQRQITRPQ